MTGFVTIADAAKRIGMSAANLRRLVRLNRVKAVRRGDGSTCPWMMPPEEVDRMQRLYREGVANGNAAIVC
jgi:hypothetical protein